MNCPANTMALPYFKKISTDQQAILIDADVPTVSAEQRQTKSTADDVARAIPDNRTRGSCQYDDDNIDLTGGGGKQCSGNKGCLSGERQAALSDAIIPKMIHGP